MSIFNNMFLSNKAHRFVEQPMIGEEQIVHIESFDHLPVVGKENITYKLLDTFDLYKWTNEGQYIIHNPYNDCAIEMFDNNKVITDPSSNMPSISEEQLKRGADLRLSIIHNVKALRADLNHLERYSISFESLLPKNMIQKQKDILSAWLNTNHRMLCKQLRSILLLHKLNKNVVEGLESIGVYIWFDKERNKVMFKDGKFVAAI